MIKTSDDLLNHVESDGDYHDGLDGWLGYHVTQDNVLIVSFEPAVIRDGWGEPGEAIIGEWKLVPIDQVNYYEEEIELLRQTLGAEMENHCDPCLNGPAEGNCGRVPT